MAIFAIHLMGASSIMGAINVVVTIMNMRAPGMTLLRMPLFVWTWLITAYLLIAVMPVLAGAVTMLLTDHFFGTTFFTAAGGGDPVMFQHIFWFFGHPEVYIMILPAMGIISEIIPVFARKPIFGYKAVAFSSVGIAFVSMLVWAHHMFTVGLGWQLQSFFMIATMLVAIPTGVKILNWLATTWRGNVLFDTPMLFALGFIAIFTLGGLTGIYLAAFPVDWQVHDTYFVVAHFHYVMFGGTVIAFLAGLHHWWPKMFGVMINERLGRIGAALVFVGFNTTFFTQFMMGSHGMPRRYYDYLPQFEIYHKISTLGSYVMAAGFFLTAYYLIHSLFRGKPAPMNPWGGNSLEWHTASPPPHDNFATTPVAEDPYDYSRLVEDRANGSFTSRTYEGAEVR
jgi:cytochrome c oxidase subunit 1